MSASEVVEAHIARIESVNPNLNAVIIRNPKKSQIEAAVYKIEQGSVSLPVGVQVVAHHWREDIVLAVMSVLEQHFRTQPDYPTMIYS